MMFPAVNSSLVDTFKIPIFVSQFSTTPLEEPSVTVSPLKNSVVLNLTSNTGKCFSAIILAAVELTGLNWPGVSVAERFSNSVARLYPTVPIPPIFASTEFKDPIVYSSHPEVIKVEANYEFTGSLWDDHNNSILQSNLPSFILETYERNSNEDLEKICHVAGAYFDLLHLQIDALTKYKSFVFNDRILESTGLEVPRIFDNMTLVEKVANRSEETFFESDLVEIKNLIYRNIYNNLIDIYKRKGSMDAFRNIIRCYGVDEELIRINLYSENTVYKLEDNIRYKTYKKKYLDLNASDRTNMTVYQYATGSPPQGDSYLSGSQED